MDAIPYVDSLIKEYLLFRGFTGTLRALNKDLASDRGCGFQADQLCELVFRRLVPLDQASDLMEVLDFLSSRVYSRLPGSCEEVIRKLEVTHLAKVRQHTAQGNQYALTMTGVHIASLYSQCCSSGKADCGPRLLFSVWRAAAA